MYMRLAFGDAVLGGNEKGETQHKLHLPGCF